MLIFLIVCVPIVVIMMLITYNTIAYGFQIPDLTTKKNRKNSATFVKSPAGFFRVKIYRRDGRIEKAIVKVRGNYGQGKRKDI